MSAHVFTLEPSIAAAAQVGSTLVLTGPEGRHAASVARVRRGEVIEVVDGQGCRIRAVVNGLDRQEVRFEVLEVLREPAPDPVFVLVQALAKGDHGELAVDQLTQAGADRIVPWAAANCVARWDGERASRGSAKWQQAAVQAAKQARRSWIPVVQELAGTAEVLAAVGQADLAVVLHEGASEPLAQVAIPAAGTVLVVVGPEGGLAESERAALSQAGAQEVRLGPSVLRTSLAGAAALAVLSSRGRWLAESTSHSRLPDDASAAFMEGWPT